MTLTELLARPVAGNGYHDGDLMVDLDAFMYDSRNSVEDRAAAIKHKVEKVMGLPEELLSGKELVQAAVDGAWEMIGNDTDKIFPYIEHPTDMNHPCARCGAMRIEDELFWLTAADDFVCLTCWTRSNQASKSAVVRAVTQARLLAELRKEKAAVPTTPEQSNA